MDSDPTSDVRRVLKQKKPLCNWIPARYAVTFLTFLGVFIVYALRANLSVTLVAMLNNTALETNETISKECPVVHSLNDSSYHYEKDGEFVWDENIQGLVLGAFFYGFCITQLPGGILADVFNAKWIFGGGIFLTAVLSLLTPVASRHSVEALIVLRVLEGLGEGVSFPSLFSLLSHWSPTQERSTLTAITTSGADLGMVVTLPVSALLCEYGFDGGWPSVFYVFGSCGVIWFLFWSILVTNTPESHPRISEEELIYIQQNRQTVSSPLHQQAIPWRAILTSGPVWAVALTKCCVSWGFYTLFTELPNYFKRVLHSPIKRNGFENSAIYLAHTVSFVAFGVIADCIRARSQLKITHIRKLFETTGNRRDLQRDKGLLLTGLCFVAVPVLRCNHISILSVLILNMVFLALTAGGDSPVPLDLAPAYAGVVMGIVNTVSSFPGIFAPTVAGALTEHAETIEHWGIVFYLSGGICMVGAIIFVLFGSSDLQPWAVPLDIADDTQPIVYEQNNVNLPDI
ncbi:sialin-like isoform X3 [Tachypleus tridentatus]|uniref:sialin-like isoform X3 n=1 Tax=Tachypleus tridentatus TaxID=6853 RepID=UPI003FD66841